MFELYGYENGEITKERFEEINRVKLEFLVCNGTIPVEYTSGCANLTLKELLWLLDQVRLAEEKEEV